MRYSLTVSLPPEMIELVDSEVDNGRYSTRSEFFRDLLRDWEKRQILNKNFSNKRKINLKKVA